MQRAKCGSESVKRAARIIQDGGVVVFPTDTVYGVGCDPYNYDAVRRIYDIKGRDLSKPLPVLVKSVEVARCIGHMRVDATRLAAQHWPGPLTIIIEIADKRLASSMGLDGSVGVRVPSGRCIDMLLDTCGMVVGTSANASGRTSPPSPDDIEIDCDMLLDGGVVSGTESTIVDARVDGNTSIVRRGVLEVI